MSAFYHPDRSEEIGAYVLGDNLVVGARHLNMMKACFLQTPDNARMKRDGCPVRHPVADFRDGTDGMEKCVDRVRARDVDDRRGTVGRHEDVAALLGRKFKRHSNVDAHRDDVRADASELLGKPLAPSLPAQEENARRRSAVLENLPKRLASGIDGIALRVDELDVVSPSGAG